MNLRVMSYAKSAPIYIKIILGAVLLATSASLAGAQNVESLEEGYLQIRFNVDSVRVLIPELEMPMRISAGDTIALPPGNHTVTLLSPFHADMTSSVYIEPGSVSEVYFTYSNPKSLQYHRRSSYFEHYDLQSYIRVHTDRDSEVFLDNEPVGFEYVDLWVPSGLHTIRIENPVAGSRTAKVRLNGVRSIHLYTYPSRDAALRLSAIPGASQIYTGQTLKGAAFVATTLVAAGFTAYNQHAYASNRDQYLETLDQYRRSVDPQLISSLAERAQHQHGQMEAYLNTRNASAFVLLGLYVANLVDSFFVHPKTGYRGGYPSVRFSSYYNTTDHITNVGVRITY